MRTWLVATSVAFGTAAVLLALRRRRRSRPQPLLPQPQHHYARPDLPEGQRYKFAVVHGLAYPPSVLEQAVDECREQLVSRDTDIWVTTFPKCGTTLMQQIVLLLLRSGEPDGIDLGMTGEQTPWVEQIISGRGGPDKNMGWLDMLQPRRVFKTHAPRHLFPCVPGRSSACTSSGSRIVVVCRNPRDAAVSMYHHARDKKVFEYTDGKWADFFKLFLGGNVESGCFFEWHRAWWKVAKADPEQILWLHYEDLVATPCMYCRSRTHPTPTRAAQPPIWGPSTHDPRRGP